MPDDAYSRQQLRQQFLKRVQESPDSQLFIKMTTRANSMIYRTLTLWLFLTSLCAAQVTKAIVIEAQPKADIQKSFGLVLDSSAEAANNSSDIEDKLNDGPPTYPWFWPGTTNNRGAFYFSRTVVLPNDWGRAWVGTGMTKFDAGAAYGSQLLMRADTVATTFDGTTNKLTTSGTSATVTVVGRTVVDEDQYSSYQMTGGALAIPGWYTIESVDTGANTWTLDRVCSSGAVTNGQGFFCPDFVQNHGGGTFHRGLSFSGKRVPDDTLKGTIGYHICTNQQSGGTNTGNHMFEQCAFHYFKTGILCGAGLAGLGANDWSGRTDSHADHVKAFGTWFESCENCFHFRTEQSVCHTIMHTRASNLVNGRVFYFEAGGKLTAAGVEISGATGTQTLLHLGPKHEFARSPMMIRGVSFDTATTSPQLVKTENTGGSGVIKIDGAIINGTAYAVPICDITGGYTVILDGVQGLAGGDAALKGTLGDTTIVNAKVYTPHFVIRNSTWYGADTSADPNTAADDIIHASSANGVIYDFFGNSNANGAVQFRDGRFIVGTGWVWGGPVDGGELTIATGVATAPAGYHTVDTESDAASDDLVTINGSYAGKRLVLQAENGARTVVVKDGTGNLRLASDRSLDNADDLLVLRSDGANWLEESFVDNGS